jgi:hypothetical protein
MILLKSFILLLLLATMLGTVGCGASTPRALQSVVVSPKSAVAHDFQNGQVQFTATGIFNKPPTRVTPFPVAWAAFQNTIATIDSNGLAQCVPGQVGVVNIEVGLPGDGPLKDEATLTCP